MGSAGEELGGYAIGDEGAAIVGNSNHKNSPNSSSFTAQEGVLDVGAGCQGDGSRPMLNYLLGDASAMDFHLDATYRQRASCRDLAAGA